MSYLDTWKWPICPKVEGQEIGTTEKQEKTGKELLPCWIKTGADKAMVKFAEEFAKHLANSQNESNVESLTTSQLRKFFGAIKQLQQQSYNESDFVMLNPKLAYAVGRAKQSNKNKILRIGDFKEVISSAIDEVCKCEEKMKPTAFRNFIKFFEAIVAYHKVYGKEK